ncbi:MAG TPA: hypothetical protein VNY29_19960 [Terriglobales bacterium]|nr:hypothetical protein [Terriglobales bacterium]
MDVHLPWSTAGLAISTSHPRPLRDVLCHNNRNGFTAIIKKAGMGGDAYGIGVAVGDCDGGQLG